MEKNEIEIPEKVASELADSAVNLEVRERALEFVTGILKRSPDAVFRVEGGAEDLEYETSDKVITENRARFLVYYLKCLEIPVEVFREVELVSSKEKEGPEKIVRISVISGLGKLFYIPVARCSEIG